MKSKISLLVAGALVLACSARSEARVTVSVGVNPYGYGAYAPPVVYQPSPYYGAPPVVYYGSGRWGDGHGRRPHGRDNHRDNRDRRDRRDDRTHGH